MRIRTLKPARLLVSMFVCMTACGCDRNGGTDGAAEAIERACDADPEIITTADGVEFVRTPDSCFESLVDWPHEPQYVEIDGLRQAYVDEGPADGPVVLLLHGQPSWSYLYRKMIPVLTEAGYRAIAMDHLGTGRSDKPTDIASYSYLGHYDRLLRFIDALGLEDITLFGQDWGGVFGLRVAGLNPSRFARIAIGDSRLRDIPAGTQLYPPVENPNESADITPLFARVPAQQFPFYIGCERRFPFVDRFEDWMIYAMRAESFHPSEVLEASTWFDLPEDAEAAYDAPFPSRIYMAGVRTFPSLINEQAGVNADARAGLIAFERPFVTLWAANDPGGLGTCEVQDDLICNVPGAAGQPHARLPEASHFLQDDQGPEIARRLVAFIQNDPSVLGNHEAVCAEAVVSKADLPRAHQSPGLPPAECPVDTPNCGDPATYEAHADASAARTGDFQSSALDPVAHGSAMMSSSGAVPVPGVGVGGGILLTGLLAGLAYRSALRRAARQPTRF